jgi:hypothetical protein
MRRVPWWRTAKNTMTRSCGRTRATGSAPSVFSSFRSENVARGMSTATVRHQRVCEFGGCGRSTLEFLYGICLSLFPSPFSPNAAITSPRALWLLLIFCVSFSLSLSFPAPLFSSHSEPARSTRLSEPSQVSPLAGFFPDIRRVKTECERDDRSLAEAAETPSVTSEVSPGLGHAS